MVIIKHSLYLSLLLFLNHSAKTEGKSYVVSCNCPLITFLCFISPTLISQRLLNEIQHLFPDWHLYFLNCNSLDCVSTVFDRLITDYRPGLVSEIICSDLMGYYVVFGIFRTLLSRNIWFHFFPFEISKHQLALFLSLWIVNSDITQLSLRVIWDEIGQTTVKDLPARSLWWASKHLNRWSAAVHNSCSTFSMKGFQIWICALIETGASCHAISQRSQRFNYSNANVSSKDLQ